MHNIVKMIFPGFFELDDHTFYLYAPFASEIENTGNIKICCEIGITNWLTYVAKYGPSSTLNKNSSYSYLKFINELTNSNIRVYFTLTREIVLGMQSSPEYLKEINLYPIADIEYEYDMEKEIYYHFKLNNVFYCYIDYKDADISPIIKQWIQLFKSAICVGIKADLCEVNINSPYYKGDMNGNMHEYLRHSDFTVNLKKIIHSPVKCTTTMKDIITTCNTREDLDFSPQKDVGLQAFLHGPGFFKNLTLLGFTNSNFKLILDTYEVAIVTADKIGQERIIAQIFYDNLQQHMVNMHYTNNAIVANQEGYLLSIPLICLKPQRFKFLAHE